MTNEEAFERWWATLPLAPGVHAQVKGLCLLSWINASESLREFVHKVAQHSNDSWLAQEADAMVEA